MAKDFSYEITEQLGTLSASEDGNYTTEVNRIAYNGAEPKLDIRRWNKATGRMGKGITLNEAEVEALKAILLQA